MMSTTSIVFLLLSLNVSNIYSARILAVFPTPSISHQVVFRKFTEALSSRGHELTIITTDPEYSAGKTPINIKEIDVHNISYNVWNERVIRRPIRNNDDPSKINSLMRTMTKIVTLQLDTKEVQDIIKKTNDYYDILLLEAWVKPTLIYSHIFKIPVILVSSGGAMDYNWNDVGSVTHPLLYPNLVSLKLYNLTPIEKLKKLCSHIVSELNFKKIEKEDNEVLKQILGLDTPDMKKLSDNIQMLFVNHHQLWIDNQPVPTSAILMAGIHINPLRKLPKDLQHYLDSSKNGLIYFSLGTNANPSNLPTEKIQLLVKTFSSLPYDVLWKWDKDELPGRTSNIKIYKWLPQSDLLKHPKIKLFITQGGLQSTDEAIHAGVPLIGLPILGDQYYNTEKYNRHKIGMRFDIQTLTEAEFKNAILTIVNNKSYHENVIRLRSLMADHPQPPLEKAVWWIEYVLRNGGASHLRASGANINWMEYYELELLATVFSFLLGVFSFFFTFLYIIFNKLRNYIKLKKNKL